MILGIDQGTTGSTALLLTNEGKLIASETADLPQHFPQAGWVEHDPQEIMKSIGQAVTGVLQKANQSAKNIQVIGLTNQRETVSLFENKKPLHRFIVWQDRRTSTLCDKLKPYRKKIIQKTGTPLDPYFSSTKIQWLYKNLKLSKKNKDIRFRTIDSFLIEQFTGEDAIEATNASRTQLMNLKKAKWDDELFDLLAIPRSARPQLIPSEKMNLRTKGLDFLPDGIPIQSIMGDQQAALFGQEGWKRGTGKITFGTGSFILVNTGDKPIISKNALVSTLALQWSSGACLYALEGSVFICGAWIQWLREQLQMIKTSAESESLAKEVQDSGGVLVVPALSGMGAPFWKPHLRGLIAGLTRGTQRGHIARASLEALCFQNRALIQAMQHDLPDMRIEWKVDGGAVQNDLLMQIQADVLGSTLNRPKNLEATALGTAMLAGYAEGMLSLKEIKALWQQDQKFTSKKQSTKKYLETYREWNRLISRFP